MHNDDNFFSRWSRRKVQARTEAEQPDPPAVQVVPSAATVPVAEASDQPAVENGRRAHASAAPDSAAEPGPGERPLPSLESLRGLDSEYRDFLKPEVGEDTRRAALKKLFADPHFNQMDGLDVYIDDYGKFEPMPAAVASSLAAFHRLSVFDHLASEQNKAGTSGATHEAGTDAGQTGTDAARSNSDAAPANPQIDAGEGVESVTAQGDAEGRAPAAEAAQPDPDDTRGEASGAGSAPTRSAPGTA